MLSTALALLLPALAAAGPASPSPSLDRLTALIPQGLSEGTTPNGAPCRVAFESTSHPRSRRTIYARALVAVEPSGELLDAEAFSAAPRPSTRRTASRPSRTATIAASPARGGKVWVRITDRTRRTEVSCLL